MGQSSDQIREEIDQRRNEAAEKVDHLQDQFQSTTDSLRQQAQHGVEDAREQVKETVDETIETVKHTMDETVETVKEHLDFHEQVQERPLVSLGVALVGGFVLGGMLGGGGQHRSHDRGSQHSGVASAYSSRAGGDSRGGGVGETIQHAVKSSGLEETISNAAAALMGSVTDQVKQTLDRNMPGFSQKMDQAKKTPGSVMDKTRSQM